LSIFAFLFQCITKGTKAKLAASDDSAKFKKRKTILLGDKDLYRYFQKFSEF